MSTNEKIVKQGFEIHGCVFYRSGEGWILDATNPPLTLRKLTEICRTVSHVVGFGLPGNDHDYT
jgi:hypothetical protein